MKRFLLLSLVLALILSLISVAFAAENVNISKLTYKELLSLQADINAEIKANHTPTDAQKELVLNATQIEAQKYYTKKGLKISGWAWYESEYTYTKDWDFYTLSTHLDYKDNNKKNHQASIYSEAFFQNGKFVISYFAADHSVVIDNRSHYVGLMWFTEPKSRINKETGEDLSQYTANELKALYNRAESTIKAIHTVGSSEQNTILGYTKLELEQYLLKKNYELRGFAWYDKEYTYIRDWDYYWLETHVDYRDSSGSSKTDKLFSEFCKIDGELTIVYLKMGRTDVLDRRSELVTTMDNGIPRYSWVGSNNQRSISDEIDSTITADESINDQEQQTEFPEKTSVRTDATKENNDTIDKKKEDKQSEKADIVISLESATDEELEEAIDKIRAEQRARMKTRIVLNEEFVTIEKGKGVKLTAEIIDIPDGQKASRIEWNVSDKNIVSIINGFVTGKASGKAVITVSCTLADGTKISNECVVEVYTPVSSLQAKNKSIDLGVGESVKAEIIVMPRDATNPSLKWSSSVSSVATVSADGTITGISPGAATITASTIDGTENKVSIMVRITKKDDRGKRIENADGVALTVLNVKQTKGSGYSKASAGNTFVLVELQIENNTPSDISINSAFGFDAVCDDYSVDYSMYADMNAKNGLSTTELKPGRKIKGWKGFEVPQNWKELYVTFIPDISLWSRGEKIEFVLYNK